MNDQVARYLSALFHPLMMPTLLFSILFFFAPESVQNLDLLNEGSQVDLFGLKIPIKIGLILLIFNFTFVLPSYLIYVLYRFGAIKSLQMETLADRRQPYLVTTLVYTLLCLFFALRLRQLPDVTLILMSITLCIGLVTIISLYWKISAHSVGISGVLGALLGIAAKMGASGLFIPMILMVILTGFLTSARLHLNAHTPQQILAGLALGLLVSLTTVYFFV